MICKMFGKMICVVILAAMAFAGATASIKTDAPIKFVTVYLDRAQITRTADLDLTAGKHTVLIENLPMYVDANSFNISAEGVEGITLLGMNHQVIPHLEDPNKTAAALERKIRLLESNERQAINDRMESFHFQKDFLNSIKEESGRDIADQLQTLNLDVMQWKEAYLFVGKALREVSDSIRLASAELEEIDNRIRQLRDEQNSMRRERQRQSRSVEIGLMLKKAGPVSVELKYMIGNATWKPLYDARLHDKDDNVDLSYFAEVTQSTGEDWDNVDLTLSTAMPSLGTGPGDFRPWHLSIFGQVFVRGGRADEVSYLTSQPVESHDNDLAKVIRVTAKAENAVASIKYGTYNTTFQITTPETISSGDKAVKTHISTFKLDNTIGLICRPRNAEDAFRLLSITNQDEAPLMPGEVSIFAGTDYLGKTGIRELISPGQMFKLPFGKDNNIKIERGIIEEKKSDKGDKWRVEKTIKITLTNNGKKTRQITLEEPFPVSQDNRIKVRTDDVVPEPGRIDEKGKAVWIIGLSPGEKKEIRIPYRIEYPKELNISGL